MTVRVDGHTQGYGAEGVEASSASAAATGATTTASMPADGMLTLPDPLPSLGSGGDLLAELTALLKEEGIRYEYVETEGDHSWPVWRRYLIEFAPKLFR